MKNLLDEMAQNLSELFVQHVLCHLPRSQAEAVVRKVSGDDCALRFLRDGDRVIAELDGRVCFDLGPVTEIVRQTLPQQPDGDSTPGRSPSDQAPDSAQLLESI